MPPEMAEPHQSAPDVARLITERWTRLPDERVRGLGYRCVDTSVRTLLPLTFERGGLHGPAAVIRALPVIEDSSSMAFARAALVQHSPPESSLPTLAAYFSALSFLDTLSSAFDPFEACFMAVMASRFVHGDDRFVEPLLSEPLD
jgi:hypothetical protein